MTKKNANARGYNYRWQQERKAFLNANPLCMFCKELGITKAANTVDHIVPHKGDQVLFWDVSNWQALCSECHSSTKQRMEHGKDMRVTGLDGWPVS